MSKTNGNSKVNVGNVVAQDVSRSHGQRTMHLLMETFRAATSEILARQQWAAQVGLESFDGRRDLYAALGYKRDLQYADYYQRYRRGGIARRIIEWLPDATWTKKICITDNPNNVGARKTRFEQDIAKIAHRLIPCMRRADILASLGNYSVILIGAPGKLETPLRRLTGPDSILYFRAIPQPKAMIDELVGERGDEASLSNPRFGLPEFYNLSLGTIKTSSTAVRPIGESSSVQSRKVHWTRVIHIARGLLEDDVYGTPELESVWNLLDDLYKTIGGLSESAWKKHALNTIFDLDPTLKISEKDLNDLDDELQDMIHGLTGYANTRGVKPYQIQQQVPSFASNVDSIMSQIAGTKKIPKRILLGAELGELASSQDRNNVNDRVAENWEAHADVWLHYAIDHFVRLGACRAPRNDEYVCLPPTEEELSEEGKADVLAKIALANANQVKAGEPAFMSTDEGRDRYLQMGPRVTKATDTNAKDSSANATDESSDDVVSGDPTAN